MTYGDEKYKGRLWFDLPWTDKDEDEYERYLHRAQEGSNFRFIDESREEETDIFGLGGQTKKRIPLTKKERELIFDLYEHRCVECNVTTPLTINHIDHDPSNNSPNNLEVVCVDCHKQRHKRVKTKTKTKTKKTKRVYSIMEQVFGDKDDL